MFHVVTFALRKWSVISATAEGIVSVIKFGRKVGPDTCCIIGHNYGGRLSSQIPLRSTSDIQERIRAAASNDTSGHRHAEQEILTAAEMRRPRRFIAI
jgi:hypothetical protein